MYGTKKGNEIFDRATQALKEFDDMDESLPPMSNNLKLKWQEDEDLLAQVPVRNGGFQYFQSSLCVVCVKERERESICQLIQRLVLRLLLIRQIRRAVEDG